MNGRQSRWAVLIPRRLPGMSSQAFLRRPVSATRARVGWVVLAALSVGYALYAWSTSEDAIRRRAERFLQAATGGEVSVQSARFSLFDGVTLAGVRVLTPHDAALEAAGGSQADREIFSAGSLHLKHNPWQLLALNFVVDEVAATRPRLTIVQNVDTGRFNWQSLFHGAPSRSPPRRLPRRPVLRLRDAVVSIVALEAGGRRRVESVALDADARPHNTESNAYFIDFRKYGRTPSRGRMTYDPIAGAIRDTPAFGLATIRGMLPKVYQQFFERLSIAGDVRSQRLEYGAQAAAQRLYDIELHDVQFTVPFSILRSGSASTQPIRDPNEPPDEAAVFGMRDIQGRIQFAGNDVRLELKGLLGEAPASVVGSIEHIDLPLDQVGLDLKVRCDGLTMPDGPMRDRIKSSDQVPANVREFLRALDPYGAYVIDVELSRSAGPAGQAKFLGSMKPRGGHAMHRGFAYRLHDLDGRVRFEPDGMHIENLVGTHGPARVRIDGHVNSTAWWTGCDVRVEGAAVPLDDVLYNALGPHYQEIWRRFDPRGLARVSVHLTRENGDAQHRGHPFQTRVQADLIETRLCFDEFPYPLEQVRGRLSFWPGHFRIDGLVGRSSSAPGGTAGSVRIDGYAMEDSAPTAPTQPTDSASSTAPAPAAATNRTRVELRVEARRLPLDDRLAQALPPEARGAFEQFQPAGRADLLGRVFLEPGSPELRYDLEAEIADTTLQYAELPYRLSDVHGRLRITPEKITLIDAKGTHNSSHAAARGEVVRMPDGYRADLTLICNGLTLDREIRQALPAALSRAWDMINPAGNVDLTTQLRREVRGSQSSFSHHTDLNLTGGRLTYAGFPLQIDDASGKLLLTDERVEIPFLTGRCGRGNLRLSGWIEFGNDGPRGDLRIEARGVSLDDQISRALSTPLQAGWRALRPSGEFDLVVDSLHFEPAAGGTRWQWKGQIILRDAAMALGFDASHLTGEIRCEGSYDSRSGAKVTGRAELSRMRIGPLDLQQLRARAVYDGARNGMAIRELVADLYGGTATGECDVDFSTPRTEYSMSFTVQNAALSRYLESSRAPGAPPSAARGQLYGKFALRGRVGDLRSRRGGGELFVREAQVWKLPLMLEIFRVLNLAPDENVFHDGWLKLYLEGRTLRFAKIDLQGKAISLVGGGTMDTDTEDLNIRLLVGSPHRLRVPLITEILEGASRDMMEVHITGKPQSARIESQPLRDLRRALEAIFPGRNEERTREEPRDLTP